jgi:DNA-binding NarL/FixJ family response regulator
MTSRRTPIIQQHLHWDELTPVEDGRGTERHRAPAHDNIRVLLVERAGLARAGVDALLDSQGDMTVVGHAASGEEAIERAAETNPDVVVMDVDLPGLDGVQTTRTIIAEGALAAISVLMLSEHPDDDQLFRRLRAGASGFILKQNEPADLLEAIRVLADGGARLSPAVARRVVSEFVSMPAPMRAVPDALAELTARQLEVMTLVGMGWTNSEIADRLVVTAATTKTHVSRIMFKLGAHSRAELVALAYQAGLVGLDVNHAGPPEHATVRA